MYLDFTGLYKCFEEQTKIKWCEDYSRNWNDGIDPIKIIDIVKIDWNVFPTFNPNNISIGNDVSLTNIELELLRRVDLNGENYKKVISDMGIRPQIANKMLSSLRNKVADALCNNKSIKIIDELINIKCGFIGYICSDPNCSRCNLNNVIVGHHKIIQLNGLDVFGRVEFVEDRKETKIDIKQQPVFSL